MKKLLFGLIAIVMFGFVGNAQEMSQMSKTASLNAQVVTFVNVTKTFYTKGQTYESFIGNLLIPSPTFPSQDKFLRKVYFYVSNNTTDCEILKSDNVEFNNFIYDLSKSPRNQSTTVTGKKKWWQVILNVVVNVGLDLLVPGNDIDIDMFP